MRVKLVDSLYQETNEAYLSLRPVKSTVSEWFDGVVIRLYDAVDDIAETGAWRPGPVSLSRTTRMTRKTVLKMMNDCDPIRMEE